MTKRRPGSDHYATIDSRRKSDQTQDTALPGDDSPASHEYVNTASNENGGVGGQNGGVGDGDAVSPESGETFNY